MKKILLVCASLFFAGQTFANDSAISGVSGTPGNLKATQLAGEHKNIRMVREHIEMQIGRDDYVTEARFVFHNDGPATSVKMGFPEGAGGDSDFENLKKKTAFKEFKTWVDGREIKATRMMAGANEEDFTLDAFWVKMVRFARGQTRNVRVRYRSPLGHSTNGNFVSYDFTGGNWKGNVARSDLRIIFSAPGTYGIGNDINNLTTQPSFARAGNRLSFTWKNWQAQQDFAFFFAKTLPGALTRMPDIKDVDKAAAPSSDTFLLTVRGGGRFNPWKADADSPPSALMRDGRAFIQFRHLSDDMRSAWSRRNGSRAPQDGAGMRVSEGRFVAPHYGKGNQVISLRPGRRTVEIGPRSVELPASPFIAGGVLYVPLAAMIEAIGGKVKVNTKTMRYWYDFSV